MSENSPSKMLKFRNLLWKLHYNLEKRSKHTSFNKLTDDPLYRATILAQLIKDKDPKVADLAARIIEQEIILGIHHEIDAEELASAAPLYIPNTESNDSKAPPYKWLVLALFLFSITLMAYFFGFNANHNPSTTSSNSVIELSNNLSKPQPINNNFNASTEEGEIARIAKLVESIIHQEKEMGSSLTNNQQAAIPARPDDIENNTILRLHGSNTVGESLAPALITTFLKSINAQSIEVITTGEVEKSIQAYLPQQGWINIDLQAHGSSTSFRGMDKGIADMGMSSRKIKAKEVALLKDRFGDLTRPMSEHILGLDGLAIIVNKANPIDNLNAEQLAGLFSGDITNWSQLGGDDLTVSLFARDGNSGTWDTFKNLVLKKYHKKLSSSATRYESSSKLSDLVAATPGGLGFIGLPYVRHAKLLAVADDANSQSILPTLFTVGTEDYPLSRRLYFYTPATPSLFMRDFIEFTHSSDGQDIVKEAGFISQNLYTVKPNLLSSSSKPYLNTVKNLERLSLNFRFRTGSNTLDNKARRDIIRLENYISDHPNKHLSLLGFSDSVGSDSANLGLSQTRAQKIAEELQRRGIFPMMIKGFGEQMPVASNDTEAGKNKNRRVEIWIN